MIKCYKFLKYYKNRLTRQQYNTLKGQIKSGDYEGFMKGIKKLVWDTDIK